MKTLLPALPASPPRRRPADLIYASDERLPAFPLLALGLQHFATALALMAYVLAAARIAGLGAEDTRGLLAVTLLAMALGTGLQSWGGRVGSGGLLVHIPVPFIITLVAAILAQYGRGGMFLAVLGYGLASLAISPLMQRLRPLFPPTVAGAVIVMGGIGLVSPSVRHSLGLNERHVIDPTSVLVSGAALVTIVALSVWGSRRFKLLAMFAGLVAGVAVAALTGHLTGVAGLAQVPAFALPDVPAPRWDVDAGLLVALALTAILCQLDTLGCVIIVDKMDNAEWRRADMGMVSRGVRGSGICETVTSLLGPFPTLMSSANIALAHATRSTSRYIGLVAAGLMALAAFLPQLTAAVTLMPTPVLGAIELYAAAYLMVSGMELIFSRAIDSRGIFTVGMALAAGLAVTLMPDMALNAPESMRSLASNGFVVSGIVAVSLNLLFRLGTSQRNRQALQDGPAIVRAITDFIEKQGAAWGARRDIVQRAALAAVEATEAIHREGGRVTAIEGAFDEFNFDVTLLHTGEPLAMAGEAKAQDAAALWDADDSAIDAAVARASTLMLRHVADRVTGGPAPGQAGQSALHLHFIH